MVIIDTNTKIRDYLSSRRTLSIQRLQQSDGHYQETLNTLLALDLAHCQAQNEAELMASCTEWWLLVEEPVDGILFEYDYYAGGTADAAAYGIPFGDFRADQVDPYGFGWHYDFAKGFEALPGARLHSLERLPESPSWSEQTYLADEKRYDLLTNAHKLTAFLVLHDALACFTRTDEFGRLKRRSPFCFVIQEHDNGDTYPLYVVQ